MIVDFRLKREATKPHLLASVFVRHGGLRRDAAEVSDSEAGTLRLRWAKPNKLALFGLKLGLEAYLVFIFAHFLALNWLEHVFFGLNWFFRRTFEYFSHTFLISFLQWQCRESLRCIVHRPETRVQS